MNRKERRAEAKQTHNININQEETMNNTITTEADAQENTNTNTNEENITMEQNTENQQGFFTRIKNAFINGYRETKTCIKEQVQEIKETYVSSLEESGNVIINHTKATIKTAMHIIKRAAKGIFAVLAWPFIKIDSIIDRKEEIVATS
jgi:hypothetical protein